MQPLHTLLFSSLCFAATAMSADLQLATEGTTSYRIVKPDSPTDVDDYAVRTLSGYLKQVTGAGFRVAAPNEMTAGKPAIFIGLCTPALERLGGTPLAALNDQDHVCRSVGSDIFLYGKGLHGNLYAVMAFLEDSLGWRWYTVYENPVVPSRPTLALAPFNRTRGFSFTSREVGLRHGVEFYYQHRMNMGFTRKIENIRRRYGTEVLAGIRSAMPNYKFVHSSFAYIPPSSDSPYAKSFDWLERKNYFETNPDFFSMNPSGQRIKTRQLCFGNPALRAELTRNVLKHLSLTCERSIITIDAADTGDTFCYCPACKVLEDKYGGVGGPMYDYLFELCGLLKDKHPQAMVKTLAYRRSQTQKPPVLPEGQRLPDNLIISFAPIEDSYFADWTHPNPGIQETYRDLLAWSKITTHLWAWLYPNPWGSGAPMPVGNVKRVITNMRMMHKAGVTGIFTDHNGFNERAGLSELQSYLLYKLMQNVDCDTDALTKEFTDHMYGAAAPLARTYIEDLEKGRKAMTVLPPRTTYRSTEYNTRTFPYLTLDNIQRWQADFDRMEDLGAGDARLLLNVRTLRRELDFATLWRWLDLKKAYPETFKDDAVYAARIKAVNAAKAPSGTPPRPLGKNTLDDFAAVILADGPEKPLPPQFDGIDRSRISTFMPTNSGRQDGPKRILDPDAAFGLAPTVHKPDMPLQFGFYQWKTRHPPAGTHGPRVSLDRDQITPGVYQLHKLGSITVTPDCWIWFSALSWATNLQLGERLYEPGTGNIWDAHVSLKCDGPSYGGAAKEDLVLVDRIILVQKK